MVFRAPVLRAAVFRAAVLRAAVLRPAVLRAPVLRPMVFRAAVLRSPVFPAAVLPVAALRRVVRRAPVLRGRPGLRLLAINPSVMLVRDVRRWISHFLSREQASACRVPGEQRTGFASASVSLAQPYA